MKLEKDCAIIETAEEASVVGTISQADWGPVTRAEVLEAITPGEGDAVFLWYDDEHNDIQAPNYMTWCQEHPSAWPNVVKANTLTIGKTVGELRELLEWCNA